MRKKSAAPIAVCGHLGRNGTTNVGAAMREQETRSTRCSGNSSASPVCEERKGAPPSSILIEAPSVAASRIVLLSSAKTLEVAMLSRGTFFGLLAFLASPVFANEPPRFNI
jgi:hypothetical protein